MTSEQDLSRERLEQLDKPELIELILILNQQRGNVIHALKAALVGQPLIPFALAAQPE